MTIIGNKISEACGCDLKINYLCLKDDEWAARARFIYYYLFVNYLNY